jgi:hypothetical protein
MASWTENYSSTTQPTTHKILVENNYSRGWDNHSIEIKYTEKGIYREEEPSLKSLSSLFNTLYFLPFLTINKNLLIF